MAVLSQSNPDGARGEEPASATRSATPTDGVLVLRDGGVLTGRITRVEGRVLVTQGGSEISVAEPDVMFVGSTLQDAYEARRRAVGQPSAESHLALADWCLRYGLYPQAAQELAHVRERDPRHPNLLLLERRLAVLTRPAPARPAPLQTTELTRPRPIGPDRRQSVAHDLPDGAVEQFTRRVQPLLVNSCAAAGCHELGGAQSFQLDRALIHGMANRRSTTANLAAMLDLVRFERPQDSPLLTVPRRDHGGMDHPVFGPRQSRQLQQLVQWVALVTRSHENGAAERKAGDEAVVEAPPAISALPSTQQWREPVKRIVYDDDGTVTIAGAARSESPRRGTTLRPWQPKDPFDPEIFNRQTARQTTERARQP